MDKKEFAEFLERSWDDGRVSRGERQALLGLLDEWSPSQDDLAYMRNAAFTKARGELDDGQAKKALDWLEEIIKALVHDDDALEAAEAFFSPGEACRDKIVELLSTARRSIDICVFTITDNQVSDAIIAAHRRGVKVRIVTDDDKAHDLGSDIRHFRRAGLKVAVDESDKHMHHKFAVFDEATVLTGSYNWTRSAADRNEENIVVSRARPLVRQFSAEFDKLWNQFS